MNNSLFGPLCLLEYLFLRLLDPQTHLMLDNVAAFAASSGLWADWGEGWGMPMGRGCDCDCG